MRKLSLTAGLVLAYFIMPAAPPTDSPHGKDLKIDCSVCHSSTGWKIDKAVYAFDHSTTKMPLTGQHTVTGCRSCHPTLVFNEAKTGCIDCHTDLHSQTVGPDCARCHTPKSWIVENITEMHQRSRFPLVGPHYTSDCSGCHLSASVLRFDPVGVECFNCHQKDYNSATQPNHIQGGYSKNCTDCHLITSFTWTGAGFNHAFFPLTDGHALTDCSRCHTNGNYTNLSKECVSCHLANYNATTNPNHAQANIPTSCADCHSTKPGWKPASFAMHDAQFFPVYSGKHQGTWNSCAECHQNSANYATFTCIDCHDHNQSEMDNKHKEVSGYAYNSLACYECHPTGSVEGSFNHSTSGFPLTGGHSAVKCSTCHTNGFSNTSKECSSCHMNNYLQTNNPDHSAKGIPVTCATCHTTVPGWRPASFPTHNNYFVLSGAHLTQTNCSGCHHNNYNSTPNTCAGCHITDFNQTTNPNHPGINIPNTCALCHTSAPGWKPATFPIHNNYYVIAGAHVAIANNCGLCHQNNYTSAPTVCVGCHLTNYNQTTNPPHASAQFPTDCETCHSQNAWVPSTFNHDGLYFPIYSGHHNGKWSTCADCHTNPANYQVFSCIDCHAHTKPDMDDKHSGVPGYSYNSAACYQCHPTGSGGGKMMRPKIIKGNN